VTRGPGSATSRRRVALAVAAFAGLPSAAAAQDHADGIAAAFALFEDRCVQALSDPDAYFEALAAEPEPATFAASSEDGSVRVAMPGGMDEAENVTVVTGPGIEQRACITGHYAEDSNAEAAMSEAFDAYLDGREDLSVAAGGRVAMEGHPLAAMMPNLGFTRYVIEGLPVPEGAFVAVNIGPDAFELEGEFFLTGPEVGR
jgi:hypothetical protein